MGQNLPSGKGLYSFDKYVYIADGGGFARSNVLFPSTFHLVLLGLSDLVLSALLSGITVLCVPTSMCQGHKV
jgi:hypothetical protein